MKNESKARKAAGKALVIFMAVMIGLTLVNTTLNELTIAEIDVYNPQRGSLEKRIDATGQLTAAEEVNVFAESAVHVQQVYARPGMQVNENEPLFQLSIDALRKEFQQEQDALDELITNREKSAGTAVGIAPDDSKLKRAETDLNIATERYEQAKVDAWDTWHKEKADALEEASQQLAEKQLAYDWAAADMYSGALDDYGEAQKKVDKAQVRYEEAVKELKELAAQNASDSKLKSAQKKVESRKDEWDDAIRARDRRTSVRDYFSKRHELNVARENYDKAFKENSDALLPTDEVSRQIDQKIESYRNTMESAEKTLEDERRAAQEMVLDMANQDRAIASKRESVEELKAQLDANGFVYAPVAGEVIEVNIEQGKTSSLDAASVIIHPAGAGFELRASVSEDDAGEMAVGDEAEIVLGSEKVKAYISAISSSKEETGKFDICFAFSTSLGRVGMNAKMQYRKRTQSYDTLVPLSALHQDNSGYYVYTILEKEGALGAQSTVERVDVVVIEKDSTRAAVSGNISLRDRIVARSDRELSKGDRVRLREAA